MYKMVQVMSDTKLTQKQEAFCQLIADGMNQAAAYRASYDAKGMTEDSVYQTASRLVRNVKVTSRIAELKAELSARCLWSREKSIKGLIDVIESGKATEKVSAIKELNVMHGYNAPTKIDLLGQISLIRREIIDEQVDNNQNT